MNNYIPIRRRLLQDLRIAHIRRDQLKSIFAVLAPQPFQIALGAAARQIIVHHHIFTARQQAVNII